VTYYLLFADFWCGDLSISRSISSLSMNSKSGFFSWSKLKSITCAKCSIKQPQKQGRGLHLQTANMLEGKANVHHPSSVLKMNTINFPIHSKCKHETTSTLLAGEPGCATECEKERIRSTVVFGSFIPLQKWKQLPYSKLSSQTFHSYWACANIWSSTHPSTTGWLLPTSKQALWSSPLLVHWISDGFYEIKKCIHNSQYRKYNPKINKIQKPRGS